MSLTCGIIKDLLPLYAENLCGDESREAVEAHLSECESCRSSLEEMRKTESASPLEALPLRSISQKIKRKQIRLVALAINAWQLQDLCNGDGTLGFGVGPDLLQLRGWRT